MSITDRCLCGQPWRHYLSPQTDAFVQRAIRDHSPVVRVTASDTDGLQSTFLVPRDYIAQHGTYGKSLPDLGLPRLGDEGAFLFPDLPAITCWRCGRTSRNPADVRERYCGNCKDFHAAR